MVRLFDGKKINGHLFHSEKTTYPSYPDDFPRPCVCWFEWTCNSRLYLVEGLHKFHLYKDEEGQTKLKSPRKSSKKWDFWGALDTLPSRIFWDNVNTFLVMQPDLVIADEPISAPDVSVRAQVSNLLKKFQKRVGIDSLLSLTTCQWSVSFLTVSLLFTRDNRGSRWDTEELLQQSHSPHTKSLCPLFLFQTQSWNVRKPWRWWSKTNTTILVDKPEMVEVIAQGHPFGVTYRNRDFIVKNKAISLFNA